MPAPTTTDELLDLLRKSGLIEPERLDAFAARAVVEGGPANARHWAGLLVGSGLLTRFQAEQILLGKWRGFTVGRYKVLERLGSGGAGTVYLCEHVKVRRKVAVKVLPTVRASNPAAVGRFHREARAAGVLNHPNLVKCHDIDQEGELHYLVMDYVDGSSLHEIVNRTGPMEPVRAAQYIRQAALGLQHAHEAGLVHRDIKPANILVDRGGTVRVLDLGLARFFHDEQDLLTLKYDENNVLGTADYVAPEQALNSHGVDIRADIYSLGCTFYYILTGRPPFPGGKAAQKLIWHQVKPPTPVRFLRPEVPEEIAEVVAKMLAKDPRERYQTPAELASALESWSAEPVPPPRDVEMPQLSPAAARSVSAPEIDVPSVTPSALGRATVLARGAPRNGESEGMVPLLPQQGARPVSMADVATPSAMASPTAPDSGKNSVRRPKLQTAAELRARARRRAWRIASIVAVSAFLGIALRFGIGRMRSTAQAPGFAIHVVSHSGAPGTLPSIQEALFRARPGDHVQVADPTWEESLHLTGESGAGRDVVLEGVGDAPVIWRTPRGHRDDQPLIYLSSVPGLHLRRFTLDGQDHVRDLVALSGACPGLTLEDMLFTGFSQSAVALNDCSGEATQAITLQRVRALPAHTAVSALRFEGRPGEGNRFIRLLESRLEGPYTAAVSFAGPAGDVEFVRNRFFNAADGVLYLRTTPAAVLGLTLASNTFCNISGVGVRFETSPPVEGSRVVLSSNLFFHTASLARVDDFLPRPQETQAAWIWVDEVRSGSELPAEQRAFRKTFAIEETPLAHGRVDLVVDSAFTVWLNGDRIGQGEFLPNQQRVQSFDVTRNLRTGKNVLAVQGTVKRSIGGVLAQLTYTVRGDGPVTVVSDTSWRASRSLPDGWQSAVFDDSDWPAAKVIAVAGQEPAEWRHLVWDGLVEKHYAGAVSRLFPEPAGNVRDWTSEENFPSLRAVPLSFDLPTDVRDDAHFLRYGRASLLSLAGSPGVAPPEKSAER